MTRAPAKTVGSTVAAKGGLEETTGKVRRPSGGSRGPTPTLSTGNSRRSTPSSSPASSGDRPQRTAGHQKPKPSAARGLRADPEALKPTPIKPGTQTAGQGFGAATATPPAPPPEDDDEPFVPDEEEEGPMTQGDGLNMAKARRQRSFEQPPKMNLEPSPLAIETSADEDEPFVPEEEEEGPATQGDGLMAAKRRMQRGKLSPGTPTAAELQY